MPLSGAARQLSPEGRAKSGELERTPEMIGAEVRMYVEAGRRITLLCGIEIGRRLVEAKEMLQHGEWLPWLEKETGFSTSSAQRYMQVFKEYGAAQQSLFGPVANSPTLGNISISNALRLLAVPEKERESFAQEHDVEHLSAREVEALVKERTAALEREKEDLLRSSEEDKAEMQKLQNAVDTLAKDRDELEDQRIKAEEKLELSEQERAKAEEHLLRIQQEIREIESRPQPVAVERDEQAIQEAVQAERERLEHEREKLISKAANDAADAERAKHVAAEKDYKTKIAELNSQVKLAAATKEQYEKEIRELSVKAEAAEKAGAESKQLRQQIKTLEGRLAVASPEVAEFKAAFDRAQAELVNMLKALRKVQDPEIRAKLSTAAKTVLGNFAGQIEG